MANKSSKKITKNKVATKKVSKSLSYKPSFLYKYPFGGYDTKENTHHRIIVEVIILVVWFATFWLGIIVGKDL